MRTHRKPLIRGRAGTGVREPRPLHHRATLRMRRKLRSWRGRQTYLQRKATLEPVIGILKEQRGMQQFLRRGLAMVNTELRRARISYHLLRLHRLLL